MVYFCSKRLQGRYIHMLEAAIEAWRRIPAENVSPVLPLKNDIMFQVVNSFTELGPIKVTTLSCQWHKNKNIGPATSTGIHQFEDTLPETNIAPGNWWLEYDCFLLGRFILRGELLVSGRIHA